MPTSPTTRLGLVAPLGTDTIATGDDSLRTLVAALDAKVTKYGTGTSGARPAASTANAGMLYASTDTRELDYCNGTDWWPVWPAAAPWQTIRHGSFMYEAPGSAVVTILPPGGGETDQFASILPSDAHAAASAFYFDPDDYAPLTRVSNCRIRAVALTNNSPQVAAMSVGLYQVTASAGGGGAGSGVTLTLATVPTLGVSLGTVGANAQVHAEAIGAVGPGFYVLGCKTPATANANANISVTAEMQVRHEA